MEQITLKLENFTGPISLLYSLIEKSKIDIYDIPISEVTSQYMAVLNDAKSRNMDIMSEFLVMAATLIEIKSRMLLPKNDDDTEEADPREELVKRLIEYKKFVTVAENLKERENSGAFLLYKTPDPIIGKLQKPDNDIGHFLNGVTFDALVKAFEDVCIRNEYKTDTVRSGFKKVERDRFTVEEKIVYIKDLLYLKPRIVFAEIFAQDTGRPEIAVTFLALLELIKNGYADIKQKHIFGDIIIERTNRSDKNEA